MDKEIAQELSKKGIKISKNTQNLTDEAELRFA